MILKDTKYSYSDLSIIPSITTKIKSRSECNPYYKGNYLPIFTAPMEGVCNDKNYQIFEREGITPIIHRNIPLTEKIKLCDKVWCAFSLSEFKETFLLRAYNLPKQYTYKVLIDVANGHMQQIFDLACEAKQIAKKNGYTLLLMGGNIANPQTYNNYCYYGIDYVRCSIGTGSQCLTSANTAIHYPNASLISEINEIKQKLCAQGSFITKIIADGGMGNCEEVFSRSIIALGLGADYVMIGGAFSSFIDSAAKFCGGYESITDNYITLHNHHNPEIINFFKQYNCDINYDLGHVHITFEQIYNDVELAQFIVDNWYLNKVSFGMSTKQAQENNPNFKGIYKTSEGKSIITDVKYTCNSWTKNFIDYLKSTMSYCNARTLSDFIGRQTFVIKSSGTINSVNK